MCSCLSRALYWGPGLQPRLVHWLGIEPATLQLKGWNSIHWATPARASFWLWIWQSRHSKQAHVGNICLLILFFFFHVCLEEFIYFVFLKLSLLLHLSIHPVSSYLLWPVQALRWAWWWRSWTIQNPLVKGSGGGNLGWCTQPGLGGASSSPSKGIGICVKACRMLGQPEGSRGCTSGRTQSPRSTGPIPWPARGWGISKG